MVKQRDDLRQALSLLHHMCCEESRCDGESYKVYMIEDHGVQDTNCPIRQLLEKYPDENWEPEEDESGKCPFLWILGGAPEIEQL